MFSKNIISELSLSQKTFQIFIVVCLAAELVESKRIMLKRGGLAGWYNPNDVSQRTLHQNGYGHVASGAMFLYRPCQFRGIKSTRTKQSFIQKKPKCGKFIEQGSQDFCNACLKKITTHKRRYKEWKNANKLPGKTPEDKAMQECYEAYKKIYSSLFAHTLQTLMVTGRAKIFIDTEHESYKFQNPPKITKYRNTDGIIEAEVKQNLKTNKQGKLVAKVHVSGHTEELSILERYISIQVETSAGADTSAELESFHGEYNKTLEEFKEEVDICEYVGRSRKNGGRAHYYENDLKKLEIRDTGANSVQLKRVKVFDLWASFEAFQDEEGKPAKHSQTLPDIPEAPEIQAGVSGSDEPVDMDHEFVDSEIPGIDKPLPYISMYPENTERRRMMQRLIAAESEINNA